MRPFRRYVRGPDLVDKIDSLISWFTTDRLLRRTNSPHKFAVQSFAACDNAELFRLILH
jgi:hypothetical protein